MPPRFNTKMGNSKCITNLTVKIVSQVNYNKNVRRVKDYIDHQDLNEGHEFRFKKPNFTYSYWLPSLSISKFTDA